MKRLMRVPLVLLPVVAVLVLGGGASGSKQHGNVLAMAAKGQIRPAKIVMHVTRADGSKVTVVRTMPWFSAGTMSAARDALHLPQIGAGKLQKADGSYDTISGANLKTAPAGTGNGGGGKGGGDEGNGNRLGMTTATVGCSGRTSHGNVRVNQDCTYRRNAEEMNAVNPLDRGNLVAGQNDSRTGYNQCAFDWSTNTGNNWGDEIPPFRQKVNWPPAEAPTASDPNTHSIDPTQDGTVHTYDADSDPALTVDAFGRSFFSCVSFDVASNASLIWASSSPPGAQGSFYFNLSTFSRPFVVAEDNSPEIAHDKEFITSDPFKRLPNGSTNPRAGNAYVTWTVFKFNDRCFDPVNNPGAYCQSPIYGSMTTDAGLHWSTPEVISGSAPGICTLGNVFDPTASPSDCNQDQGSDPKVLPNGDLVVTFQNASGPGTALAQVLAVHCNPSGDSAAGTAHFNCASPRLVAKEQLAGEPTCDFGRGPEECIPGVYIRTNPFPRIGVNRKNGNTYVTWQDYQRRDNGAKEWSIQLSKSTDGGLTWTGPVTVNPDTGLDHYFPAIDIVEKSSGPDQVGVSYYRTERVPSEATVPPEGFNPCDGVIPLVPSGPPCETGVGAANSDYVLAGGTSLSAPYSFNVLSPVFPPPDGIQAGFNGDYSGLTINRGDEAHPIWSDTRNVDPYSPANGVLHDEDVFTDAVDLPNGHGHVSVGRIGRE